MGWSTCKYCGEKIVWAQMPAGNYLPMDPENGGLHECVPFDRAESYSTAASTRTWNVFEDRSHLTFSTACWWCGAAVYFYRDENGGCVLFDELGPPWPVHPCWEDYRSARRSGGVHLEQTLTELGYDGRFYQAKRTVRVAPSENETHVNIFGFVVDNRALYQEPKTKSLRASRRASSGTLTELWVSSGSSDPLSFLIPLEVARPIQDFRLVRAEGFWVRRGRRWVLVLQELDLLEASGQVHSRLQVIPVELPLHCRYCGAPIPDRHSWGFDPEFGVECRQCSGARGRLQPKEFIDLCRKVSRHRPR